MPRTLEKTKLKKLREYFKEKKEVRVAYLFGSAVRGKITKLSDIDVGVFLDESLSDSEMFDLQLKIMGDVSSILETDKIDLVVMNKTGLLLNYNIIKHGKILKSDEEKRVEIETKILSRYLDQKYYIQRHANKFLERVAEEGLI